MLEINDDSAFPEPFERRRGLAPGAVDAASAPFPAHPGKGEIGMDEVRATWQRELDLDEAGVDELIEDFWRWYVGTLDQELFDWFAGRATAGSWSGSSAARPPEPGSASAAGGSRR